MTWAVWFTGLPGSGKSTIARKADAVLKEKGEKVKCLELDEIRKVLTPEPKYTEEEREIVYAALAYMAKLLVDEGTNVLIDATGNLRKYREKARKLIPDFAELYVSCPVDVAMAREAKRKKGFAPQGIYEKGKVGKSQTVPGLNVPYEPPADPIAVVDTTKASPEEAGKQAAAAITAAFGGSGHG